MRFNPFFIAMTCVRTMDILLQAQTTADIPILTIAPAGAVRAPVVFFVCGYGGTKEVGLSLGYQLARLGLVTISFDPWLHGDRYDPRLDQAADPEQGGLFPPESGLDTGWRFFQVIRQSCLDIDTLCEQLAADPRLDLSRCGVTGLSLGGYVSYLALARLPQIRAAVPMIGIPTFARRWQDILDESAATHAAWEEALAAHAAHVAEWTAFVEQIDPMDGLQTAAPRPLLMMNCDFDSDQPKLYALDAYRALQPAYTQQPQNLRLNIYPAGHTVTPQMEKDAAGWLVAHLSP